MNLISNRPNTTAQLAALAGAARGSPKAAIKRMGMVIP
jgi:hypothetical protein